MISADILLKGLGGVAVVGGATGMGVCYQQKLWIFAEEKKETLEESAKKVGLDCTGTSGQTDENGKDCTIKTDGLSIKQGTNKDTAKKKGAAQTPDGKIRGYKVGNGFKFVIEEGDIALTGGAQSTNITKLEQFETYEIEEDGDKKQYLTRKKKSWEEKRRLLGIPEEEGCAFPESGTTTTKECPLDKEKIKKLKFGGVTGEPTVKDPDGTPTLSLKISITPATTDEATQFPFGYKFTLISNKEITLGDSKANKSIKKDTNTEYKIKKSGTGKDISLSLEKAWTVKTLGAMVGLTCPETVASGVAGECSLSDTKINVKNGTDDSKKFSGLSKKTDAGDKKVKVEIEQEGYNQGFKFFVEDAAGIALQNGADASGADDNKKIEYKGTDTNNPVTYEILKDTDNKWYLTKKTKTPGGA